jgi:hypothetical protein
MRELPPGKTRLMISVVITEKLRIRLIELGVSPSGVAKSALLAAVSKHDRIAKRKKREGQLEAVRKFDPRIRWDQLTTSTRARRLRKLAKVQDSLNEI